MTNRVAEILNIEKPIIEGPMFWLTDAKLVAAVSNAGGLGVLGYNAGQTTLTRSVDETVERMRNEIRKTRELTNKPIGMNFQLMDDRFFDAMLNLMVEEKVPVAVCVGDFIAEKVAKIQNAGITIVYRPIDPSVAVVKEAVKAGVDIIAATGFDEGGTIPKQVIGTIAMVPMLVDAAGNVPVVAAGGIADTRTAKAMFDLGAEGLLIGTAFMMSEESRMADSIKEQAIHSDANDLVMYRAQNAYYRSLPGKLPSKLVEMDEAGASREEIWNASNRFEGLRRGMLDGDLDQGFASFGLGISLINKVEPISVIMDRLYAGVPKD